MGGTYGCIADIVRDDVMVIVMILMTSLFSVQLRCTGTQLLPVVFVHHRAPAQWQFLYTIPHLANDGFSTRHPAPPNGRFRTPSHTHLSAVFVHHCPPAQLRFLYIIAHPSDSGFLTPPLTPPMAVFILHSTPAQW